LQLMLVVAKPNKKNTDPIEAFYRWHVRVPTVSL
jgi:hypothetical protein